MAGSREMGPEELRARLAEFDRAVSLRFPWRPFTVVVAGGSALALLGRSTRPTADIDTLRFEQDLLALMEQYDLNGRAVAYADCFPYDFENRLVALDLPTRSVRFYSVSLEDLVVSKLCSARPVDTEDVRNPDVVAGLDWDRLQSAAAELEKSMLNPRRYQEMLVRYRAYREEFGPCKD